MNVDDLTKLMNQMKVGTVPSRLVFIWTGPISQLEDILQGVEIHKCDLANCDENGRIKIEDPQQFLEKKIKTVCKDYNKKRTEPSVLVLKNAILLIRYGCNLSTIFQYGISPRSAVIFLMPKESHRHLPVKTTGWVKKDTRELIARMARQLGIPNCIIDI